MEKKLYFTRLDALRFFAFFLVFWQHGFANSFLGLTDDFTLKKLISAFTVTGGIGVHIFFVISGFLITFLMLKEEVSQGKVNLWFFYLRRILRIWPLFYFILILGMFVLPTLFGTFTFSGSILKNLFFLNNYDMQNVSPNVGIAWSVAIEEQFYLFWPLIFIFVKDKKKLLFFCVFMFLTSSAFIIRYGHQSYFHTLGNVNYLMTGCIGAIIYFKQKKMFEKSILANVKTFILTLILIAKIIAFSAFIKEVKLLSIFILPFLYLHIIIYLVDKDHSKSIKATIFSKLGKYTYGMYLYHPMIIIFTKIAFDLVNIVYRGEALGNLYLGMVSLVVTIIIAYISYEYFEKHILNFKNKFSIIKTRT